MNPNPGEAELLRARRDFLRRTLKAGVYVPPALVVMSMRNIAVAASTCPGQGNCGQMNCGVSGDPNCP